MKKINNYAMAILVMVFVGFVGCEKDILENEITNDLTNKKSEQIKPEVEVIDGVLHFRDIEAFVKITDNLGEMDEKERDNWENNLGFKSLRTSIKEVYDLIELSGETDKVDQIIKENDDLIYKQMDEIIEIIPSHLYQSVSDKSGVFFVNGIIQKVVENKIYTSKDGMVETINKAIKSSNKVENVRSMSYFETNSPYGCYMAQGTVEKDRRKMYAHIKAYSVKVFGQGEQLIYYWVSVQRYSASYKKNWFGNYYSKAAHHHRKEIYYLVSQCPISQNGPGVVEYGNISETFWNDSYGGSVKTFSEWKRSGIIAIAVGNPQIPYPYFVYNNVTGKFDTQGYGGVNSWLTINCN